MKNIHIIPTDKPSRLIIYSTLLNELRLLKEPITDWKHKRHIYITSDEDISGLEDNIWVLLGNRVFLWQNTMALVSNNKPRKIILTDNQDLIKDGVQGIDDTFLEWFVKNPSCESVEIEKGYRGYNLINYKIIIPKEEITIINGGDDIAFPSSTTITFKPLPDVNWESDITNKVWDEEKPKQIKCYCGHTITCDCEPKQEILEEFIKQSNTPEGLDQFSYDKGLKDGAKWQKERMYSEEEVYNLLEEAMKDCYTFELEYHHSGDYKNLKEWFEQYKKKFG
jgi:hypothetical protein